MNEAIYVREIAPDEKPAARIARSGDRLPNGSVLLWQHDMDRMGLQALRDLLVETVMQEKATLVLGRNPAA